MYCKLVKVSVDVLHEFVLLVVVSLLRGKLNRRLSSSSGVDTFEATLARDVLIPSCTDRMILLTSSSIPSSAMSNEGGNAGMGKNGRDSSRSMAAFSVSVPLGNKTDQKLSSPFLI